jgi:hypothetical protein
VPESVVPESVEVNSLFVLHADSSETKAAISKTLRLPRLTL